MLREEKLFIWDAAGRFAPFAEEAFNGCRHYRQDLIIYSLTQKGEKEPSRLIVKMMPIENPESGSGKQTYGPMFSLNYRTCPPERLKRICSMMKNKCLQAHEYYVGFGESDDGVHTGQISVEDFFSINPREDEPGAEIYLRDKAFFQSVLPDPMRPDFAALPLLTDAQKEKATEIDLSCADVRGRRYLTGLFSWYKSVRKLDLSAFDTAGVVDMREMFLGCKSLRRLDLSMFDFSSVRDMKGMFSLCPNLEEVILSDTVLDAGSIPHSTRTVASEDMSDMWRSVYISEGRQLADMALDRAMGIVNVPYRQATQEERERHLLYPVAEGRKMKFTIVPHRR